MPGIFGIISSEPYNVCREKLDAMRQSMLHKSFYVSNTYTSRENGTYVGQIAHEDSPFAAASSWNVDKNICLFLSGEIFQDACLQNSTKINCKITDHESPLQYLNQYSSQPETFFGKLNGWFSGVVIDLRNNETILFNDRYGMNRLYYYENKDDIYFASEAKAILKLFPFLRTLDFAGVGEFLSCGCVLQNRTIFKNINLIPPASIWRFKNKKFLSKSKYFTPESWENQEKLDDQSFYLKLKDTFSKALPRYLRANRSIGMSLTGGFDARMIMAWARCAPNQLRCYTFGSMYRVCQDERIAKKVATICSQPHETIVVDQNFFPKFSSLAEDAVYFSDGTMDVTGSVELYVNEFARQISPIRLTGNYGSEILRGNIAFKPVMPYSGPWVSELMNEIKISEETYRQEFDCNPLTFIAFKQVPWHHYARLSLEKTQLIVRSPYLDNDIVALAFQASRNQLLNTNFSWRLIKDGNIELSKIATDFGYSYRSFPIIGKLLSLYQNFTFRAEYAFGYGMPQWLAQVNFFLNRFRFENIFMGRHKFYHFRPWYRDVLSGYIKDILLDPLSLKRPYIKKEVLVSILNSHFKGHQNHTTEITQLLTLELIQRLLIEKY